MLEEINQAIIPVIILLFVIWLFYRINKRIANKMRNSITKDFPFFKNSADSFQRKIDFICAQLDVLEKRIFELETKIKAIQK